MKAQFLRQVILVLKHKISHRSPNSKNFQKTISQLILGPIVTLQGKMREQARIHASLDHVRVTMKAH